MNQPREYDAVLGGLNPPVTAPVLGGFEGVRRRFEHGNIEQRVAALSEALKYGEPGLNLVIQALGDASATIERAAYLLLLKSTEAKTKQALENWEFFR